MSPHGDPTYRGITELAQLPEHQRLEIAHFFTIYRHLDPDTWVRWTSGRRHRHRICRRAAGSASLQTGGPRADKASRSALQLLPTNTPSGKA